MTMAQLTGSACAAALFSAGEPVPWRWRTTRLNAGMVASNDGRTLTNVSAGDNTNISVWTDRTIWRGSPNVYWELVVTARGAGANLGYVGVAALNREILYEDLTNAFVGNAGFTSIGWRENGEVWANGANVLSSLAARAFTTGDVLGIAFCPNTGEFWFRKNGTWLTVTTVKPGNGGIIAIRPQPGYKPYVHLRDQGDAYTLRSRASEFSNAPPDGFIALADLASAVPVYTPVPLRNAGADDGTTAGWTAVQGGIGTVGILSTRWNNPAIETTANPTRAQQRVVLPSSCYEAIDAGAAIAAPSVRLLNSTSDSTNRLYFQMDFLDATGATISTLESEPLFVFNAGDAFVQTRMSIPAGTRVINYRWRHTRPSNHYTFDDFALGILTPRGVSVRSAAISAVLGKPQGVLGVRRASLHAIIVP